MTKRAKPWAKPGYSFQVRDDFGNLWPPGFVSRLAPPTPTEASRAAISAKQHQNRQARLAAGPDPLTPPMQTKKGGFRDTTT